MSFSTETKNLINNMNPAAAVAKLGDMVIGLGASPIVINVDGGGSKIINGAKSIAGIVPRDCEVIGWKLVSTDDDQSALADTLAVDILVSSAWNTTPASVVGSGVKPFLTAEATGSGTTVSGWTRVALVAGQLIAVTVSGTPGASKNLLAILEVK